MAESASLIKADGVCYSAGKRRIIDNISMSIEARRIVTIIGPNGSGKTTLIKTLLGLTRPQHGKVRRKKSLSVGYVPQDVRPPKFLPVTTERFLQLFAPKQRTGEVLDDLGMRHLAQPQLLDLSNGERQFVFLARALLGRPDLLVMDEPMGGVDIKNQIFLYDFIARHSRKTGAAVVLVSHDLHVVMANSDDVICLHDGHICCQGSVPTVLSDDRYQSLFGEAAAKTLAVYQHHHSH